MTDNTTPANFLDDCHQRIRQAGSAAGWEHLTNDSDKMAQHDKLAETIAHAGFVRLSYLDRHEAAQEIAMKTIQRYRDSLHKCSIAPEITDVSLLVLFGYDPSIPVPIDELAQLDLIAYKHLSDNYTTCDISVTFGCDPNNAAKIMPVKVGEFVCIYKVCDQCRAWFDLSPHERDCFGGTGWIDDIDRR
jgi:hypothetical protein